jgi:hypothetical protein
MYFGELLCTVRWDEKYKVEVNIVKDSILIPMVLKKEKVDMHDIYDYCERRLPPKNRKDVQETVRKFGLIEFQPLTLCRMCHGTKVTDAIWLRFLGEEGLNYEDVRIFK